MTETTLSPPDMKDFIPDTDLKLSRLVTALHRPPSAMSDADRAEYLSLLNGEHPAPLDPDTANRILDQLWSIMNAFVDLGFGIGPATPPNAPPCGQVGKNPVPQCDKRAADALHSSHQTQTRLNEHASAAGSANSDGAKGGTP